MAKSKSERRNPIDSDAVPMEPVDAMAALMAQRESKPTGKGKRETRVVSFRADPAFLERIKAAAKAQGLGERETAAFIAWLVARGLDELEAGRLSIPRRERPDL